MKKTTPSLRDRRSTVSVSIPLELLKKGRMHALKEDLSFSHFITIILRRELEEGLK